MIDKITLPSGALLDITPMPYEDAWAICQTFSRCLEKINVDLKTIDFKNLMATDILHLKGPICSILASQEIIDAAKKCFPRCTINGMKIDGMTFEKVEARGDFIPTVFYVLKENIAPFFANLLSFLSKK